MLSFTRATQDHVRMRRDGEEVEECVSLGKV